MEVLLKMPSSSDLMKDDIKKIVQPIGLHDEKNCTHESIKENYEAIECAKAEMGEVREENERLKMLLERIENDYKSLQFRFFDVLKRTSDDAKVSVSCDEDETQLVSLSLGRMVSESKKEDKITTSVVDDDVGGEFKASLSLALEETNKEDNKMLKTVKSGEHDDVNPVKRARVSVRARCDTPTMNDGCQWRKYGQKIAKGNPCPRAYYRCTVAAGCPVRKQVQRCADDMSILITTYEGKHNHPLPVSATAMASTTSAAASMMLSGSSTSQLSNTSTTNGFNFNFHDDTTSRTSKHLYPPNNASLLSPTITLDLTNPSSQQFNTFSSRFPSSFSFSSPDSNLLPTLWGSGYNGYGTVPYNQPGSFKQSYYNQPGMSQQVLTETLTKAITTNPSFRSVIAAAISSMVGTSSSNVDQVTGGENFKACGSSYFNGLSASNSSTNVIQSQLPFPVFKSSSTAGNNSKDKGN